MKFREDIQGLRAFAVILVIIHHAFPTLLPGGYIGVDIFFVISGFLITSILIEGRADNAARLLLDFYARRARRIIPIAALGIVTGSIVAQLLLGPVIGADSRRDGLFALLFIANWHFNNLAIDYFTSELPPSIFQHFWSLAVEEQFYLLWPILIVAFRRWAKAPLVVITLLTAASLSYSMIETSQGSGTAFFATRTRIWELGFGALLALSPINRANGAFSTLGLATLLGLAFLFTPETGFPGLPALAVVLATLALLITGERNSILRSRIMVYIGDISFSLYIWHWIFLQISILYLPDSPSTLDKVILLLGVFALSAFTAKTIERPVRKSRYLKSHPISSIAVGLSIIIISLLTLRALEVLV
jgi:peptidoglycan/LPS O-acetylase OafA/YrhL